MKDMEIFIQFRSIDPYICHPKLDYKWHLADLLQSAYECHIMPDGTVEKEVTNNLKRIAKLLNKFAKEKRKTRMFRFSNSSYLRQLLDIDLALSHLSEFVRNTIRTQDKGCQTPTATKEKNSQNPSSKPSDVCCPTEQTISAFCSNLQQTKSSTSENDF